MLLEKYLLCAIIGRSFSESVAKNTYQNHISINITSAIFIWQALLNIILWWHYTTVMRNGLSNSVKVEHISKEFSGGGREITGLPYTINGQWQGQRQREILQKCSSYKKSSRISILACVPWWPEWNLFKMR